MEEKIWFMSLCVCVCRGGEIVLQTWKSRLHHIIITWPLNDFTEEREKTEFYADYGYAVALFYVNWITITMTSDY